MRKTSLFCILIAVVSLLLSCHSTSIESDSNNGPYSIKRISSSGQYKVYEVEPRSDGSYNIYGFIRVPNDVEMNHLVVKVHKVGKEQPYKDTTEQVRNHAKNGDSVSDRLKAITLFISLPETNMRDGERYMALDTNRLLESGEFGHIDRQICNMIDDVLLFVKDKYGKELPREVDMFGYSGEGTFIVRFALLHPQYLHAVCAGGTSWSPSVALEELKGEELKYPLGLDGIERYTKDFNLEQWKRIHFFIDIGELDDRGSYNRAHLLSMRWSRNLSFPEVYDVFCDAFVNLTDNAEMVLYHSLGHEYKREDYIAFLKQNDGDEFVPIKTSAQARVITSSGVQEY